MMHPEGSASIIFNNALNTMKRWPLRKPEGSNNDIPSVTRNYDLFFKVFC